MEYGIIGNKLSHSFSAQIHPKLFNCTYEKKELKPDELNDFFQKKDFKGINVTIPYKTDVIKYLDYIEENAKQIGAVNTIVNDNGKLSGYNTDYFGMISLIKKNNVFLENKNVLILGSGATSLTACAVAKSLGAKSVIRLSRSQKEFCDTYNNIEKYYKTTQIIINTTPCGMYPNIYESAIEIDGFNNLEAVFDVVYNPIRTKLICDAIKKGVVAEGGTYMLVFQAVFAARLFSGVDISNEKGNEIYENLLKEKENVVLIGMPSSGKSTISKEVASILNRPLYDSDELIFNETKLTPKEIIETKCEKYFRKIESETIKKLSKEQGAIISTGGGTVLDAKNIELLKENGMIIFIDRNFENLISDSSRPLSSTKEKLMELYNYRLPIYKKSANIIIDNNGQISDSVQNIIKAMNL